MDTVAETPDSTEPKRLVTLDQFDTQAKSEAGIVVELDELPLDDDGKPYVIELLGMDARTVVTEDRKKTDKLIRRLRANRDTGDSGEREAELIDRLAKATTAWHLPPLKACQWFTPLPGQEASEPPCTERNARSLYSDPRFRWILRKVTKAFGDETRFFATPSGS